MENLKSGHSAVILQFSQIRKIPRSADHFKIFIWNKINDLVIVSQLISHLDHIHLHFAMFKSFKDINQHPLCHNIATEHSFSYFTHCCFLTSQPETNRDLIFTAIHFVAKIANYYHMLCYVMVNFTQLYRSPLSENQIATSPIRNPENLRSLDSFLQEMILLVEKNLLIKNNLIILFESNWKENIRYTTQQSRCGKDQSRFYH